MITKFARLEFELFTKPSKSDFYEFVKFDELVKSLILLDVAHKRLFTRPSIVNIQ